jgi:hypothetical protein
MGWGHAFPKNAGEGNNILFGIFLLKDLSIMGRLVAMSNLGVCQS